MVHGLSARTMRDMEANESRSYYSTMEGSPHNVSALSFVKHIELPCTREKIMSKGG